MKWTPNAREVVLIERQNARDFMATMYPKLKSERSCLREGRLIKFFFFLESFSFSRYHSLTRELPQSNLFRPVLFLTTLNTEYNISSVRETTLGIKAIVCSKM